MGKILGTRGVRGGGVLPCRACLGVKVRLRVIISARGIICGGAEGRGKMRFQRRRGGMEYFLRKVELELEVEVLINSFTRR